MRSLTLTILLAVAVLAATFPLMPQAAADIVVPVHSPVMVVGTQVIENGEFVLTVPYTVTGTGTLIIRNATVWLDMPTPCWGGGGVGSHCHPSILALGGRIVIDNSTIDTHKDQAKRYEGWWAIIGEATVFEVKNSVLRHFRLIGNQVPSLEPSRIFDNTFEQGFQAIHFLRGAELHLERNTFRDLYHGVSIQDASGTVRGNTFRNITVHGLIVQNSLVGMRAFETMMDIEGNQFASVKYPIMNVNSFPNRIVGNEIRGGVYGIAVGLNLGDTTTPGLAPVVEDNRISDVQMGLIVAVNAQGDMSEQHVTMSARGNSFERIGCTTVSSTNVWTRIHVLVDASGSWWGSPAGPQPGADPEACPAVVGNVTVAPWLTEAP